MEMLIGKLVVAEMKEINNRQNARYAARRPANNSNPNEESLVRRVQYNRHRNERNRLRQDKINN